MSEFKREDRYLVLKRSDIDKYVLNAEHKQNLYNIAFFIDHHRRQDGKQPLGCVVVESDWQEYEQVWQLLEARVTGKSTAIMLKGVGKINGDGWKDTTEKGQIVYVWNIEHISPYVKGQFPRVGCAIWSASTNQYDFEPVPSSDVKEIVENIIKSELDKTLKRELELSACINEQANEIFNLRAQLSLLKQQL